jgi:tetratricopeptide (TPR) repeat protein
MLAAILVLLALHSPQTARDIRSGPPKSTGCAFTITGRVIFPAYAEPVHFFDMELESLGGGFSIPAKSGPYESIFIEHVPTDQGFNFNLKIELPGYDVASQFIALNPLDCHSIEAVRTVYFDVQLHRSPALKPPPLQEDTVSIKTLMSKVPEKIVETFEKNAEQEAKAGAAETATSMEHLLQEWPDYYDANLALGLEYQKTGRRDDSIRALNHALELNAGSMIARSTLGGYHFDAGDFETAAKLLDEAARLGSTSPWVYYMLGTSFYKMNRLALAETSLRRALAIAPEIGTPYLQLYNVYMKSKTPDKALKAAQTYLEKYPKAEDRAYVQSLVDKLSQSLKRNPQN